jgi:hypothetical protein
MGISPCTAKGSSAVGGGDPSVLRILSSGFIDHLAYPGFKDCKMTTRKTAIKALQWDPWP